MSGIERIAHNTNLILYCLLQSHHYETIIDCLQQIYFTMNYKENLIRICKASIVIQLNCKNSIVDLTSC